MREENDRDVVHSLVRGLDVLRVFTRRRPHMTVSEVAQATDLTRAAARRFLLTLVREGYVQLDGKYFSLKPKVLELGYSALSSADMWDITQLVMAELTNLLQESCFAAVLEGESVIYVARTNAQRLLNVGIPIGNKMPAYAGSTGRVLLAGLPEAEVDAILERMKPTKLTPRTIVSKAKLRIEIDRARRQGWSIVDQEIELGLHSVSVPIRNASGEVLAALNIGCPIARVPAEELRARFLPELLAASERITLSLKAQAPPLPEAVR